MVAHGEFFSCHSDPCQEEVVSILYATWTTFSCRLWKGFPHHLHLLGLCSYWVFPPYPLVHYGGCIKPHYLNWCLGDPISSTQRDVIKVVLVAVAWVAMDTSKLILYHGKEYMLLSSHTHRMSIGNQSVPQLLYWWWLAASAMTSHKLGCSLR